MIPKIIHQTWKTASIPNRWEECARSWRSHHPDWEYRLWTDQDCVSFISEHFPNFLAKYLALPYAILRADVFRYLVILKQGGLYADLDTECLRSFEPLLADQSFIAALEPVQHARLVSEEALLGNAIFAAAPSHPFLSFVVDELLGDSKQSESLNPTSILCHQDVLDSTGPIRFHSLFSEYSGRDITLVPAEVLYPLDSSRLGREFVDSKLSTNNQLREQLRSQGSYSIHYWENSWCSSLAGELRNENPNQIEGYVFFPGQDSLGSDFGNKGRDIEEVAQYWLTQKEVVGFNTDGFAKYHVRPQFQWRTISHQEVKNEGLYIKEEVLPSRLIRYFCGVGKRGIARRTSS